MNNRGRRSGLLRGARLSLVCVGVLVGFAVAQQPPAGAEPKDTAKDKPQATKDTQVTPGPSAKTEPAGKVKPKPKHPVKYKPRSASKYLPGAAPKQRAASEVKPGPDDARTFKPGAQAKRSRIPTPQRKTKGVKFEMNPDAKWVCDKPTSAVDPIWRGQAKLTFNFDIRNEGTADLRFRAKGG